MSVIIKEVIKEVYIEVIKEVIIYVKTPKSQNNIIYLKKYQQENLDKYAINAKKWSDKKIQDPEYVLQRKNYLKEQYQKRKLNKSN